MPLTGRRQNLRFKYPGTHPKTSLPRAGFGYTSLRNLHFRNSANAQLSVETKANQSAQEGVSYAHTRFHFRLPIPRGEERYVESVGARICCFEPGQVGVEDASLEEHSSATHLRRRWESNRREFCQTANSHRSAHASATFAIKQLQYVGTQSCTSANGCRFLFDNSNLSFSDPQKYSLILNLRHNSRRGQDLHCLASRSRLENHNLENHFFGTLNARSTLLFGSVDAP